MLLKVPHCYNYFAGDPYIGNQAEKVKSLNKRINGLENEVKGLRRQLDDRFDIISKDYYKI